MSNLPKSITELREAQAAAAKEKQLVLEKLNAEMMKKVEANKAERQAALAERSAERQARQAETAAAQEQRLKEQALATWRSTGGGSDGDFERAWPQLKAAILGPKLQAEQIRAEQRAKAQVRAAF